MSSIESVSSGLQRAKLGSLALAAALALSGCNLFNTADNENTTGRGAKAFDPYQGAASGSARLALFLYNGCAVTPNGQVVGKGNTNIPYPECRIRPDQNKMRMVEDPSLPPASKPLELLAGTSYFLNELTLMESEFGHYTDPGRLDDVSYWMRNLPKFRNLDWGGLIRGPDEYAPSGLSMSPYASKHVVKWEGANWQKVKDDTFTVEVLDADGQTRGSVTYDRKDFLVSNPAAEHTTLFWEAENLAALTPDTRNSVGPVTRAPPPGFPPMSPPAFRSVFKVELVTSTAPNKSVALDPNLIGDGSLRVTWSQLPDDPFYFPVTFIRPTEVPRTCYLASDPTQTTPCAFGLNPEATFAPPESGTVYQPGENVQFTIEVKDGRGNLLHPPDRFPSWTEYAKGESNGLMFFNFVNTYGLADLDTIAGWSASGPKHLMTPIYDLNDRSFFRLPTDQTIPGVGNEGLTLISGPLYITGAAPGAISSHPPTTYHFQLPADAKPGTYTLYLKFHRYFLGERFTKMRPIEFQVGQAERTLFPNRVGNCQTCHRGVQSLDNVRHGMSVDNIEGCKTCHNRDTFAGVRESPQSLIHRVHAQSDHFPAQLRDCTTCHLTRASTLRPSLLACGGCHVEPHGNTFDYLKFVPDVDPSLTSTFYSNCAGGCHEKNVPSQHILPPE